MEDYMNVFRVLGDLSHAVSKLILIWAIHSNKSAEGVSLITQALYVLVFCTRYLDVVVDPLANTWWNLTFKIYYTTSTIYTTVLMTRVYARTREREKGWKLGAYCLAGSAVAAPFFTLLLSSWRFTEVLYTFSLSLESVCVLPQLLLLRQTTVPTVIDSYYLLTLGSYRGFYILNWVVRYFGKNHTFYPISVIFGIVQTALYVDFAWVYWTRQRVKLRNGGLVDSDDLSRGWLVSKVLGGKSADVDEEDVLAEPGPPGQGKRVSPKHGRSWGIRGISVSADSTLADVQSGPRRSSADALADPHSFEDYDSEPGEENHGTDGTTN